MRHLGLLAFRSPTIRRFYATELPEPVRLDPSNPKWVQVCTAGSYVYRGEPVDVTLAHFDQMSRNFRAHPAYDPAARALLGRDPAEVGALVLGGKFGVVALNFDHPPDGGPRPGQGWLLDVERRGDQLWALTFFGERAHAGMLAGEWKWTSIEWNADTTLPTGQKVGAYLSGLALTNDPFIQGMTPIQCSRPGEAMAFAWSAAVDVLVELRRLFGLPDSADLGAVIAEIAKLRMWAMNEAAAPVGVDVPEFVKCIRALLNLPTLADPASIFAELDKLLGRLAAETPEEISMPTELHRRTAALLTPHAPGVTAEDETRLVVEVVRYFDRAGDVMAAMDQLGGMLGTKDPKQMNEKLTGLMALATQKADLDAQIAALLPEVEAAKAAEDTAEQGMIEQDVNAAMAAKGLDPAAPGNVGMSRALRRDRIGGDEHFFAFTGQLDAKGQPVRTPAAERRAKRAKARTDFFAAHGISLAAPGTVAPPQTMTFTNFFAGPGAQFGAHTAGAPAQNGAHGGYMGFAGSAQNGGGAAPPAPGAMSWEQIAALPPVQAGDNPGARIVAHFARTEHAGKSLTEQERTALWRRAGDIIGKLPSAPPAVLHLFTRTA